MRNVLLASLAAVTALLANGCVPFGCGGFEGGGNRAYERESQMLLLCSNGGFVVTLDADMLEGRYVDDAGLVTATRGDTGAVAFEVHDNFDGTVQTTEQLGDGAWTAVTLDAVALDHSNVLCNDLATRDWWVAQ